MIEKLKQTANAGSNPWFPIALVLIGAIVGYGFAVSSGPASIASDPEAVAEAPTPAPAPAPTPAEPAPEFPAAQNVIAPVSDENMRGDANATISIIEYSDFECPFCARHHGTMKQIMEEVDDVNWVYRHFPLGFHANAQKSAEASECAAEQDKFWEYTDHIYENGADIAKLATYAEELGLDVSAFQTCLDSDKYAQAVKDETDEGSASGVRGTPGNIVYNNKTKKGVLVSGAQSIDRFKAAIEMVK